MVSQRQLVAAPQALTIHQVIQRNLDSFIARFNTPDATENALILVGFCSQLKDEVGEHGAVIDAELGKLLEIFTLLRDIVALDLSQYTQRDLDDAARSELAAKQASLGQKIELLKRSLASGQSQAQLVSYIFQGLDLGRLFTWTPEVLELIRSYISEPIKYISAYKAKYPEGLDFQSAIQIGIDGLSNEKTRGVIRGLCASNPGLTAALRENEPSAYGLLMSYVAEPEFTCTFNNKTYNLQQLCDAAFDGDLVMINAVLSLDPSVLGKSTKEGETLLTNAVAGFTFNPDASPEVLTVLLQAGANRMVPCGKTNLEAYVYDRAENEKDSVKKARYESVRAIFRSIPASVPVAVPSAASISPAATTSSSALVVPVASSTGTPSSAASAAMPAAAPSAPSQGGDCTIQ